MRAHKIAAMLVMTLFFVGAMVGTASADKVYNAFKKKVVLSDSPFPNSFDSDGDMIRYLKKVKKKEFIKNKWGKWEIEFILVLKKKLKAKEVLLVFYDMTYAGEEEEEIYSVGFRPSDPYTKILSSYFTISDEFFVADHTYELHIKKGDEVLGKATFKLIE